MLGYIVPVILIVALFLGCQLTFQQLWISVLVSAVLAVILPYGDLHGTPLVVQAINLPKTLKSRKRRKLRRHRYS